MKNVSGRSGSLNGADWPDRAITVLGQLRKAGVSVAMDDFGTGYSSLSLLVDLPLDIVKIDRSFVNVITDNQRSRSVVEAVIHLSKALKLSIVAEGVETDEQLALLKSLGCHEVQGYHISKPMPGDETTEFLRRQYSLAQRLEVPEPVPERRVLPFNKT